MEKIEFNGNEYPMREVYHRKSKMKVLVASHRLEPLLFNDNGYTSKRAKSIDENIYGFVMDDAFALSDKEFENYINKMLD